jgi:hypothetical protein
MPAWLLWATLAGLASAYALVLFDVSLWHPGYAYGDERNIIWWLQSLREGASLSWKFGRGCLSLRALWLWVEVNGTGLAGLHTPQMAALALEWLCLALVARRWFGEEAAAWSLLAAAVSAQAWVSARSLLSFQALPMETLLLAALAGGVRSRTAALAWGAASALLFYEYDGAFIAVPAVWLACVALDPAFRRRAGYSGAALLLAGLAIFLHESGRLASYAGVRLGSIDSVADQGALGRLGFLKSLFTGGQVLPYFGVSAWPAWPWWTWAGLAAGVWHLRRSPGLWLAAWALGAVLVALMAHSNYGLPLHRLAAAVPALALLSGLGLARLRLRLGARAWVLGLLLLAGAASEGWAWWRHQMTFAPELYNRCSGLNEARLAFSEELKDPSLRVLSQLNGLPQGDVRFVLDRPLALGGPPPDHVLAIVPAAYADALGNSGGAAAWFWEAKGLEPTLVVEARGAQAARLSAIQDSLAPLIGATEDLPQRLERTRAWMRAPRSADPWTWTAVLEADLQAAVLTGRLGKEDLAWVAARRPVSDAPWMVLARASYKGEPRATIQDCRVALALNPRDGEAMLLEERCLRGLGDPEADALDRRWTAARASGHAWRDLQ